MSQSPGPVFVVAPPGAGSGRLAEALALSPSAWTTEALGDAAPPELSPAGRGWDSDRLTATDAHAPGLAAQLRARVSAEATGPRLVDATPANALRVPFLAEVFPDAFFLYVHRDPGRSLAEMLAGWSSGRHVSHPDLPGWDGPPWSYPLTPEWRALRGKPLQEVCAAQWVMTMRVLLGDLERLPGDRWCGVEADADLRRVAESAGVAWDERIAVNSPPIEDAVDVPEEADALAARARALMTRPVDERVAAESPLRSVASTNLAAVLDQLGSSLLVSTYQTGKLVAVRRDAQGVNTHFRAMENPMGVATRRGRLAVGTRSQVVEYHDVPALLDRLEPPGLHDACFVPRRSHTTGDIRIHEIAYAADELWLANTRFSCLCTLDDEHSFVPRWRPPFITAHAAEDRCHLNGLAVVDDEVRYVTMLGASDEAGGWREHKAHGGLIMDVPSSEPVVTGLSMPHSPRWYRDRLWVLESGEGSIGVCDLDTGRVETVAQLPGFTRGLSFLGPLAFIGLSEVRESSTFGGLPLTGRLEERQCGVWVVNIETGQTIAFLRFEDAVQEIFAVHALPGVRFPEIAEHGSDAVNLTFVLPDAALAPGGSRPPERDGR